MSMMSILKSLYTVHKGFEDPPTIHLILDLWTDIYIIYIYMHVEVYAYIKKVKITF